MCSVNSDAVPAEILSGLTMMLTAVVVTFTVFLNEKLGKIYASL